MRFLPVYYWWLRPALGGRSAAPVADFSATPLSGPSVLTIHFTDLSANSPTSWAWEYSDNGLDWTFFSSGQNPTLALGGPDVWHVRLTATNANGSDTKTRLNYITVGTAVYLLDTFTGTTGTALTAHTMDVGPGWTAVQGTFKIVGNRLQPDSGADGDIAITDAGFSDFTISCDLVPRQDVTTIETIPGLLFRYADSDNFWLVQLNPFAGNCELYEQVSGAYTQRGSNAFGFVEGNSYAVSIVCAGAQLDVYVDAVDLVAYGSAASGQTQTLVGVRLGLGLAAPTSPTTWDNFQVTP